MKVLNYPVEDYPFRDIVCDYLGYYNLQLIHQDYEFDELLAQGTDQSQILHRTFYDAMDNDSDQKFVNIYKNFIKFFIGPIYSQTILYQKFPTFRVHQPSNIAVFGWHRDRDYNHNPEEINYYLPITDAFSTNTFWHESEEGKKDYQPMEAKYGEIVEWDGANCRHGNKQNDTGYTRISFDFRVLTMESYERIPPKKSITQGKSFEIGDYYEILK